MMFTKKLLFLRGQVDPVVFIKKLFKAKIYAMLYRIDYGLEENPLGIRKPNNHFLVIYIYIFIFTAFNAFQLF